MNVIVVIVVVALMAGMWALARRGESRKLRRLGELDADAGRRSARARDEGWSRQYNGTEGTGGF
jgi:hypothetical protein